MRLPDTILFATSNPHKLEEVAAVLGPLGIRVEGLETLTDPIEDRIDAAAQITPLNFSAMIDLPALSIVLKKQRIRVVARQFNERYPDSSPLINRSNGERLKVSVGGLEHYRHRSADPRRLALLERIDELLRDAMHIRRERPHPSKMKAPNTRAFHRLAMPVTFGGDCAVAILILREDSNGIWLYEGHVHGLETKKPAEDTPGRPRLGGQLPASQQAIRTILRQVIEVKPFPEPVEDGHTFTSNAVIKARYYAQHTGRLTLADDSGLAVDALHGAPGVHSARFAGIVGPRATVDPANNARLLDALRDVSDERRTARFVCVMALCDAQRCWAITRGEVHGRITHAPRGQNGFGYDPLFLLPDRGLTTAELSPHEKNQISHRGQAARALADVLQRFA